ncbi:ethanolamine ammonia-lyase reactivating factor EutA [Planococcus sp. S3-L1]|uniref:ethanolamine ammonia-lyase reactivating factor EutA n=1 Tax=Planococcus sp. S3-L1 TaxID=3046200 RepID=UPI0024BA3FCC|nr:ethanolamine ammonia-lyase reactivating factor EutA [Planococcus sp. S3-L1]MDJ0332573.1 ethanolamine ammonia-lyase reactivating factor EutA [Planococcus sp. S3-L1]
MAGFSPKTEKIISAGIDIGTSTTKLVISEFSLTNVAGSMHVPRIEIVDKQVLYKSPIFSTPLKDHVTIDVAKVVGIVKSEYEQAGIVPSQIETGAVIITGETATKDNAREMIDYLSNEAGEFLVATAGPDLEGIIAAKGSGAYEFSGTNDKVTANIDIGGGTANIAVYKSQELLGTCTLHIGGRLLEFQNGQVSSISPPIQKLLTAHNQQLSIGDDWQSPAVDFVLTFMAQYLSSILTREATDEEASLLLGHLPNWQEEVEVISFSGGISECMYQHESVHNAQTEYSDMGMQLAEVLQNDERLQGFTWLEPIETVRATVLGAGMQTTEISGATIQVSPTDLPMKNVPVYHFSFDQSFQIGAERLEKKITEAINMFDAYHEGQNFALYISQLPHMSFRAIQQLAADIIQMMERRPNPDLPIVLILQTDHARVLGQTLMALNVRQSVICIDQIVVEHGDYIDIGRVLESGVVPVVVKTLTFHSS